MEAEKSGGGSRLLRGRKVSGWFSDSEMFQKRDRQRQRETWTAGQASLQFQKGSTLGMSKGDFRAGPGHSVGIRFRRGNLKRLIPNGREVRKARVGG